jgi:hypothetical protein
MRNQPRYEVCQLDERLANATMNMISGRPDILYTISWHRSPRAALRALLKILEEPTDEEKQQQAE